METISQIEKILKLWDLYSPSKFSEIQGNVFRVSMDDGRHFILKNIGDKNDDWQVSRIPLEYDVLHHVEQSGVPVAVPILSRDGIPYAVFADQVYCLYPYFINNPAEVKNATDRKTLYRNYGMAIARFHQALATYPDKNVAARTWGMELAQRTFEEEIPGICEYLSGEALTKLRQMVEEMETDMRQAYTGLPQQLIIWDCHPGNVVVNGLKVSGFVDCNHLSIGPRTLDLADFLVHLVKWDVGDEHKTAMWLASYNQFLIGYERIQVLDIHERKGLFYVMLAILIMFANQFSRVAEPEDVKRELDTFAWMYEHRQEIIEKAILSAKSM